MNLTELKEMCKDLSPRKIGRVIVKLKKTGEYEKLIQEGKWADKKDPYDWLSSYCQNKINKCPVCGAETITHYCSFSCRQKDPEFKNKCNNSMIEHFGTTNTSALPEVQAKRKKTCLERYGVDSFSKTKEFDQKSKETMLERYGVDNTSKLKENIEKRKKTCFERYGTDEVLRCKGVRDKGKITNLEKYGDEYITRTDHFKNLSKETCIEKYGKEYYVQTDEFKQKVENTCLERYGTKNTGSVEKFIEKRVKAMLEKYGELPICSKQSLEKARDTIYRKYGVRSVMQNEEFRNKMIAKIKSSPVSKEETKLFNWIDANKIHNTRSVITPYEIDIFLPDVKLGLEYDGIYYHDKNHKEVDYHLKKTTLCEDKGIDLLHVYESDNIYYWKSKINSYLNRNTRIYARKCKFNRLSIDDGEKFLNINGIVLDFDECYGLKYNNEIVQVAYLYKQDVVEILTKNYCNVIGGLSRLLKHIEYNNIKVDRRKYTGKTLVQLGYNVKERTAPVLENVKGFEIFNCGYLVF